MREHLLVCIVLLLLIQPSSLAGCLAWSQDREYFRNRTVYFQRGRSLVSAEARQQIVEVANYLKTHPSTAVNVEGYCDDRGSEEHNRALGDRRARAVSEELVCLGVPADRVDSVSFGEDRPIDKRHNAKARQKNRRVEFVLLTPPK